MTAPSFAGAKKVPDQAERRVNLKIGDQHGRKIHVIFDRINPGIVGIYPQFKAPWLPALDLLTFDPDEVMPTHCVWDYQEALARNHREWDRFFDEFRVLASKMPGIDAVEAYHAASRGEWEKVPSLLIAESGMTPEPEEYIKAAMAENSWVLGFQSEVPGWAKPLVALKEARRRAEAVSVNASDLDRYRDGAVETDYDDEAERQGEPGGVQKITKKKPTPNVKHEG